jgi:hypothetical protein
MPRGRSVLVPLCLVTASVALAACDTGDGKQLAETDRTMPPTTTSTTLAGATDGFDSFPVASEDGSEGAPVTDAFTLTLPWAEGGPIDVIHSCDGDDVSPAFSWTSPPDGTAELAIAMVDLSAGADGVPVTHWVASAIDPAVTSVAQGTLPVGAVPYPNDFGTVGWSGPCPPPGDPAHLYRVTLYALNQPVNAAEGTPTAEVLATIEDSALARVDLTGTYGR